MTGYVRQSVADILPGEEVRSEPLNAEFNRIQVAFDGSVGHTHDGTAGSGPPINLTTSITGTLPVANGGTGGTTLNALKTALSLGTAAYTSLTDYATAAQGTKADGALQRSGGAMTGAVNMGGFKITNLAVPTVDTDAATRKYVLDTLASVDTSGFAAHVNNKSNPHETTKAQVGLGNVDNQSVASILTNSALTGVPTAPTPPVSTNTTQVANTAFVQTALANVDLYSADLIKVVSRSSNTALTRSNKGNLITLNGTFSQTLNSAATLGDGWYCFLRNIGTGDITLDPGNFGGTPNQPASGSNIIDDVNCFIMYPGEFRLILCNGSNFRSVVLQGFSKSWISSDVFYKPPGYSQLGGMIRNGGSSGSLAAGSTAAYGGSGGGAFPFVIPTLNLASSLTVTVGSGGPSVSTADSVGIAGGDSSFAGLVVSSLSGRHGGAILQRIATGGATGFEAGSTASTTIPIYGGGSLFSSSNPTPQGSIFGGAAGQGIASTNSLTVSATSVYAGNGGLASLTASGQPGAVPSGGGAGARNGFVSGAGGRGQVDIWGII